MARITQFSDTHFSTPGHRSHAGFGYDTDEAWAACRADAFAASPDLVVHTGDVADRGQPVEYAVAIDRLAEVPSPVNVVPGNHDFHVPLSVALARPGVTMDRTHRLGPWLFVYADSNHPGRDRDETGRLVDRPDRIANTGGLGAAEVGWISEMIAASDAEHVWLWMHHPPAMPGGFAARGLDAEITDLIAAHPHIRGIGAGHVHTDLSVVVADRPVHVCPALTINIDFERWTTLPPGYRTYDFADDGTVTTECHLVDDERWPRIDLPDAAIRHFKGEIGFDEMVEALRP